jgi:hypothetical protein
MSDWISVDDELPKANTEVLVASESVPVGLGLYLGHETFSHNRFPVLGQFVCTHWMPLPEPPNE